MGQATLFASKVTTLTLQYVARIRNIHA